MRRFNSKRSDSWYTGFEHRSQCTLGLNIDLNYGEETLKALICAHKSAN